MDECFLLILHVQDLSLGYVVLNLYALYRCSDSSPEPADINLLGARVVFDEGKNGLYVTL